MIDWPLYNESLVRRGQVLLDFDVLDGWDHELSQMNRGKVGEPYDYPNSFIQLLGYMRVYFHLPYIDKHRRCSYISYKYKSTVHTSLQYY